MVVMAGLGVLLVLGSTRGLTALLGLRALAESESLLPGAVVS
jgi:hypothetical protein